MNLQNGVTPLCGLEASPSELLQSRLLRTGLPISNKLLEPKTTNEYGKKVERKLAVKSYHDKSARSSSDFNENQDILFKLKKDGYWTPGKVLSNTNTPRSYLVSDENGRVYKRNSSFLKNTKNPTVINASNNNENININCKPSSADESSENTCLSNRTDVYNENGCGTNNNKTANECTSVKEANSKCTRSGRVVNVPNRLRDYYT
ncbi:putative E3 ubiquitin-protein ligase protein PFF1365c [Diorhabda sublineata]|uniref:putative E3 ubiquitin-protein ligase protein PFF1365c n=1 Tax=Diorhabda sublineata TaxID=1163346 RepID=UPI0024E11C42|nr:putative E3 ubiquitin-protein ligase protein PFF1365c [Diorhabda sublineata]